MEDMESEESRHSMKRKQSESNEERESKLVKSDEEGAVTVEEMMRWLDQEEIYRPVPMRCQCGGWSSLTINGDEESCGPSFSDDSSTVMASIDTRSFPSIAAAGAASWAVSADAMWPWGEEKQGGEMAVKSEMGGKGWDGEDEEWLEDMLTNAMVMASEFLI